MCRSLRDRYDSPLVFVAISLDGRSACQNIFSNHTWYGSDLILFKNDKIKPLREVNDRCMPLLGIRNGNPMEFSRPTWHGRVPALVGAHTLSLHIEELIGKRNESWSSEKNSQWRGGQRVPYEAADSVNKSVILRRVIIIL